MSTGLLLLVAVAIVNAPRVRSALPHDGAVTIGALAAAVTWIVSLSLAAFARPLADAVDLSAPTIRMAVGAVVAIAGAVTMLAPPPAPEPAWSGRKAALVPVAFPVLLTPGLGLLALSGSLDRGAPAVLAVFALALATVPLLAALGPVADATARARVLVSAGRVLSALAVLGGLALIMNGVFDI